MIYNCSNCATNKNGKCHGNTISNYLLTFPTYTTERNAKNGFCSGYVYKEKRLLDDQE
jgi:hypothetical protein